MEVFQVMTGKIRRAFFTTGGKVSGSWKAWNFINTSLILLSSNAQFTAACSSKMLGPLTQAGLKIIIARLLCLIAVTTSSVYAGEEMAIVTAFYNGLFILSVAL